MSVFGDYAKFYDALYEDKDYAAECDFIEEVFTRFSDKPVDTILDLGCGTGGHAGILAERGYRVTGVDRSEVMLTEARQKISGQGVDLNLGDVRFIRLGLQFNAAISMFAVMSYMSTNDDLLAAFGTASNHLKPGGLLIFDSWFGPAVLSDPPVDKVKEVEFKNRRIIRYAHPEVDIVGQVVTVNFRVLEIAGDKIIADVVEAHRMRPIFVQEVIFLANQCGMELVKVVPFMRPAEQVSIRDWNVSFILRKKD